MSNYIPAPVVSAETLEELGERLVESIMDNCPTLTEFGPTSVVKQLAGALALGLDLHKYFSNVTVQKQQQNFYSKLGLEMIDSTKAVCDLTFTLQQVLDYDMVLNIGTMVQSNTTPPVIYETTEILTIPAGEISGTVKAQAKEYGSNYRVKAGVLTKMRSPIGNIANVTNTVSSGGQDQETIDESIQRMRGILQTNYVAVTPASYETIAEQVSGVYRAKCYPTSSYYFRSIDHPSQAVLLIQPDTGQDPDTLVETVDSYMRNYRIAGVPIDIRIPDSATINVSVQVKLANLTLAQAQTAIRTSLENAFKDWDWMLPVTIYHIRSIILNTEGIVSCAVISPVDETILGKYTLPILGTLSVTT